MSLGIFLLVLASALLHATWNSIVKSGTHKLLSTALLALSTFVLAAVSLPFVPVPPAISWPYLVFSVLLQVIYYVLVAINYKVSDISLSYPLMRGSAPLLVAIVGTIWLNEHLDHWGWVGISLIVLGILSMAWSARQNAAGAGVLLALLNALVIATYTLVDGMGVRVAGNALSYSVWLFFLSTLPVIIWAALYYRRAFVRYVQQHWLSGCIAGAGSAGAYALALWAMLYAPIALVAALRETSIVFVTLIAMFILRERVAASRLLAVLFIALGAGALRLA